MADYPKPDGWQGGAEGGYLNTLHGHVSSVENRSSITPDEARNCTDDLEDVVHQYDEGSDDTGGVDVS